MNLKDKMPNQELIENEKKQQNLSAITQKSSQLSKEMLLQQQSEALKQVTEQRDNLLKNGRQEDQEKIRHLSSENSGLKKELRMKSEKIVSLNDWIEMMSESDLIVKQNEKLKKNIIQAEAEILAVKDECNREIIEIQEDCNRAVKEANDRADEVKKRYADDNAAASKARSEGEYFKAEQQRLLLNKKHEIDRLAELKIAQTKEALRAECNEKIEKYRNYYHADYVAKETWHIVAFTFCVLWLVIQALSSNYFRHEVMDMGIWIKDYAVYAGTTLSEWTKVVANITSNIPNEIVASIFYWIVFVIVGVLLAAIFYALPLAVIFGGSYLYFRSDKFDKANRWMMVSSGILFVAIASEMFYQPPINFLLLWLIIQVVIPVLRCIVIPLICSCVNKFNDLTEEQKKNVYRDIVCNLLMVFCFILAMWALRGCAEILS